MSLYPVVTEAMILRVPSRTKSFFNMFSASARSIQRTFKNRPFASHCWSSGCKWPFCDSPLYTSGGDSLTVRELIEEQRTLVRSGNPAERFAAALLLSGALAGRLRELDDFRLGQVLDREVCSGLSVLAPELAVCMEAAERLCRQGAEKPVQRRQSPAAEHDDGDHLLHAESALYWGRIPHLLLPFQRDKFASDTFVVPSAAEARHCLCQAGFRETPRSPSLLIDRETGRPIRVVEHRTQVVNQGEPSR